MRREMVLACRLLAGCLSLCLLSVPVHAENVQPILITQAVDESKLVRLGGNTRPEANAKNDRGRVADTFSMEHLLLLLKRSPEQERELQNFIEELHDSSSPAFHRWLTAKEFGERFGVAQADRDRIESWLRSHGLKVNVDYTNGLVIDFSGTADQLSEAFHTEIHDLDVKGVQHIANMSDPEIPAALAPAVAGVVSLHDFRPQPLYRPRAEYTVTDSGKKYYLVVPGDLATIYNLSPLFSAGISGQGQTIVVIENTDVFDTADWASFRSVFGLSSYSDGSFTEIHPAPPSGTNNCSDPGVIGSDQEAILDAEYSSAAAPSAAIVLASCTDTATFGGLIALQNLLNASSAPPAIVSISYGECEANNGATANAAFNSTFQQAVTEGVSVFVAAGDHAAAGCDIEHQESIYGIGVTGFGTTPYNVAVGGTDFGDTYAATNSTYWKAANSATYESAKSYVPEIPWNDSCGSSLLAEFEGFSQTYGASGFCNSNKGTAEFVDTVGGSGGPSGCATGAPSQASVVSGTCAGWPKPVYQSVLGNPRDGVRDIPDVSLFAADGVWLHYYPYCFSGPGGAACTEDPIDWPGAGGTSFASPIMAGIQALVNQNAGARQGNPNYVYYSLANAEYGSSGDSACDSKLGNAVDSSCIFYDVRQGDNDVDCLSTGTGTGTLIDCYLPSGEFGVLSTSNSAYQPAFGAAAGWDFASGIGTVNAANLVNHWPSSFAVTSVPNSVTVVQGSSITTAITITRVYGFLGNVILSASGLPNGVAASFNPDSNTTTSTLTLTATATAVTGTVAVMITGTSGSLTQTTTLNLTVNGTPNFTLSAMPDGVTVAQGSSGASTITVTRIFGFSGKVTLAAAGLPSGVTASFTPNPTTTTSTLTLTASATAVIGTAPITITGTSSEASGSLTQTTTLSLSVTGPPNFSLSASPNGVSITQGNSGTSTITIAPVNGFNANVTLAASGLPSGVTAAFSPNPATTTSTLTLTASTAAVVGTVTVTITGTSTGASGALNQTTTLSLTVNGRPNFTLSASPNGVSIMQGSSGTSTIAIVPVYGFAAGVTLTAAGLPSGVTAAFSPNPVPTASTLTSILTLTASNTATTGTTTLTITGTSTGASGLTASTTIALTVIPMGTFTLTASPSTLNVFTGAIGASTITTTSLANFSSAITLSVSGLPSGVTAIFSTNPITPAANGTATSVLTLTALTTAATGTATVTVTGTSGAVNSSTSIALTVSPGALTAVYNPTLMAPECATVGTSCDSGPSLLLGRDSMAGGPEPNQPNTINNSCADGTDGAFHVDESNDRIVVTAASGVLTHGTKATVTATVWAWSTSLDALDLYYAANANNPSWVFIKTIVPGGIGAQKLSATFTLPVGSLQAVRAQFRFLGVASPCTPGTYNDRDDLIFAVQ